MWKNTPITGGIRYNRFETTEHYLSSKQLIDILIDKVANGGNFLLNIGPDATGMIPVVMQERLLDIGKWLKVNGDAIYFSQPWKSPNRPKNENLLFTRKGGNLYILLKKWPKTPVILTGLKGAGKVELLGYKGTLNTKQQQGKLTITFPPSLTVDELPSQHAWVIKVSDFRE